MLFYILPKISPHKHFYGYTIPSAAAHTKKLLINFISTI